jgi:NTE family protein
MVRKTSVSLVLGSGGARGLAHIGVIHELEQHGFEIRSISGCSIGALIGGIHAAGKLDRYAEWVTAVSRYDMVKLLDFAWQSDGLVKGDRIIDKLIDLTGNQRMEDLPIRFTAVATDITEGSEIWLSSGRLFDAIRASISLPLFFTPFEYRGRRLIDGGVLNPVPIAPTFGDDTDLTIAVNLSGKPAELKSATPAAADKPGETDANGAVGRWIDSMIDGVRNSLTDRSAEDWTAYDVAIEAFEAMQGTIARQKLAAYPPDIEITIPRNACAALEFDRAREMIELGHRVTLEQLAALHLLPAGTGLSPKFTGRS